MRILGTMTIGFLHTFSITLGYTARHENLEAAFLAASA